MINRERAANINAVKKPTIGENTAAGEGTNPNNEITINTANE